MTLTELEHLRKVLNPVETIPAVEQCRIVAEALANETVGNGPDIAEYLGVSKSQVSKMVCSHNDLIPELKDWFRDTAVGVSTLYMVSRMTPEAQGVYWDNARLLGS